MSRAGEAAATRFASRGSGKNSDIRRRHAHPRRPRPKIIDAMRRLPRRPAPERKGPAAAAAVTAAFVALLLAWGKPAYAGGAAAATAVALEHRTVAGVPVTLVTADLRSPRVRVTAVLPRGGRGTSEPFGAMITRTRPTAAITGTFFATDSLLPIGDIVIGGRLAHFGGRGAALCLTADPKTGGLKAAMRSNAGRWRHTDWGGCQTVLAGGMWLVRGGAPATPGPRGQGFRDPSLFRPNPRVAVGITARGKLLLAVTRRPVSLERWARALRTVGAVHALNLDGGSSTALFFRGRTLIRPGRRLTNVLVVHAAAAPRTRSASL